MRFTAIQLRSHDVRLDDLSPGMNVVFAATADRRRLLATAIRAAIFGVAADEVPECRLSLQSTWGGFHLEYMSDGSVRATDSLGHDRSDWLRQKLAALTTEAAFSAVYTPRWGDPVALDTLACVLCGDGLSGKRLAAFESLLRDLENTRSWRERDQQQERLRLRQAELEGQIERARHAHVEKCEASAVALLEAKVSTRARRLARLQKTIRRAEEQLATLAPPANQPQRVTLLRKRVDEIQRHVQRLVMVLQDLRRRSGRLRDLLGARATGNRQPVAAQKRHRSQMKRYEKMIRCQTALSEQLSTLISRRQRLQSRIDALNSRPADHQPRHRFMDRLQRLRRREQKCRDQLKMLEARRAQQMAAGINRSLHATITSSQADHVQRLEAELAEVRAQLARWSADEQREADALLARMRSFFADRRNPSVLNEAALLLQQLSDGGLVGIRAGNHGRELIVEHADGRSVSCDVLSRGERVQVQLSLCLAAAASAAKRGANFPVILNDVTRHIEPPRLRSVVEILRNHGRAAGQVVLLTSQPHVATLCRSLGASSYSLEHAPQPLSASPSAAGHSELPIREKTWDCEEFPGELRDRIRYSTQRQDGLWAPAGNTKPVAAPSGMNGTAHHELAIHSAAHGSDIAEESLRSSGHYLELCDRVTEIPFLHRQTALALEQEGVYTVANLLHADAVQLSARLVAHDVSSTTVRQWQSQAALMCTVRRLRAYDAKILSSCGITTAEQLADIRPHELYNMIQAFVATPEGSRIVRSGADHEVARLTQWIRSLQRTRQNAVSLDTAATGRSEPAPADRRSAPPRTGKKEKMKRSLKMRPKTAADHPQSPSQGKTGKAAKNKPQPQPAPADIIPLRFHLDVTSHVEAAPAIGPTMAKRLEKIGISTVGDLLTATPEEVAAGLKNHRVSAATIRQWQRQASLVCRVPELRGHDAQLLVACGIETPERLSAFKAQDLAELVLPFVKTKQGRRLLRNGKEPDAAEIAHWIQWARHARQLAAA